MWSRASCPPPSPLPDRTPRRCSGRGSARPGSSTSPSGRARRSCTSGDHLGADHDVLAVHTDPVRLGLQVAAGQHRGNRPEVRALANSTVTGCSSGPFLLSAVMYMYLSFRVLVRRSYHSGRNLPKNTGRQIMPLPPGGAPRADLVLPLQPTNPSRPPGSRDRREDLPQKYPQEQVPHDTWRVHHLHHAFKRSRPLFA